MNAIRYNVETVLFILLILLSGISPTMNAMIAPVTYSVRGKVIDRQSRQPVAYANVFVAGIPGKGASTDSLGTFKIEQVPPGIYGLEVLKECLNTEDTRLFPPPNILFQPQPRSSR